MIPSNTLLFPQPVTTENTQIPTSNKESQTENEENTREENEEDEINRIIDEIVRENCICFLNFQTEVDCCCICQANKYEIVQRFLFEALSRVPNIVFNFAFNHFFKKLVKK